MDAPLLLVLLLLGPPARGGPSPDPPSTDPSGPSPDPPSTDRPSPGPSPGPPSTDPSGPSPGPPSTDRPGPSPDPPSADRPSPGPSPGPPSTDPPGPSPGPPSTDPPGPGPGPPSTDPPGPSPGPPSTDPPGPGPGPPSTAPPGPEAGPSPRPSAARPSAAPEGQSPPAAGAGCPPACPCDLRRGACDVACCCDADCDPRCDLRPPRAAFARCLPGSTRAKTQVCVEQSLIFRNNTPYPTETVTDSSGQTRLFCVQLNDSKLNYFQQPQEVTESNFPVLLEQYGGPSFVSPSQPMPPPSAFYRVGDPIQTYFVASSVVSTLRQPVGMGASRLCVDSNPAGFLESKSTSCTRTFTNLSSSCTTDPALDAASYYRDFTVLKTPLNMTVTQSMQVKVTPLVQPEAPQMQGSTCHNIVSEVIYNIEFNGTHGIRNVSVQFKVTNISEAWGSSLQQHFTLHFWSRTPSPTLPRSGNPGYITGAPLLALQKGVPRHVTVLKGQGDGICSQSLKHTVLFGMNVRTSCKLRLEYVLPAVWFPCPWRSRYCGQRWASCPTHKHKCWEHGIRISAGPYSPST
ncbi:tectonic-3 isoform X3 [Alligator mississippiensis]|uniref:tectonic-3 isoform X3 n=1 Tax=Alligator mississippiensis TaxID=8496 RepID=UPI0028781236|nr:tectonic-3 isoform X3 [Alligator mississippiensis]